MREARGWSRGSRVEREVNAALRCGTGGRCATVARSHSLLPVDVCMPLSSKVMKGNRIRHRRCQLQRVCASMGRRYIWVTRVVRVSRAYELDGRVLGEAFTAMYCLPSSKNVLVNVRLPPLLPVFIPHQSAPAPVRRCLT
jgi:hypothetical protein